MKRLLFFTFLCLLNLHSQGRLLEQRFNEASANLESGVAQSNSKMIISSMEKLREICNDIDDLEQVDSLCFQLIGLNSLYFGKNSAETGEALCRYAGAKIRKRDNESALRLLEIGEPYVKVNVGTNHPLYATVWSVKGSLAFTENRLTEAANCYNEAVKIYREATKLSKENLRKYRNDYAAVIAARQYALALAGKPSDNFKKDFELINRLYENDKDEISYSDALFLKASAELKYRDLYNAWKDTEKTVEILKNNLGKDKIFKSINTAMQLANILQLLNIYQDADILLDEYISAILTDPNLDQYGALGSLYMMKANGMTKMNVMPEDAEYYACEAMNRMKAIPYLKNNYLVSRWYRAIALNRLGRNAEAAEEAWQCYTAKRNKINDIDDLEKKYLYWLQYANIQREISSEKSIDIYMEIADSFSKECKDYADFPQFASWMSGFMIQMAQLCQTIYSEKQDKESFSMAENAWKDALDFNKRARFYEDSRGYYHNMANLYALNGNTEKGLAYADEYYAFLANGIMPTLAMLTAKDRERHQKSVTEFACSTVPMLIGNKTRGKEINLLLNSSLLSKSLLLSSERQIHDIVKSAGSAELDRLYSDYIKCKSSLSAQNVSDAGATSVAADLKAAETALLRHPAVSRYMSGLKAVDWRSIQRNLQINEAIVDFVETKPLENNIDSEYLAIILSSDGNPELVKLPGIIGTGSDFDLNSIYERVWKPLSIRLSGKEHIFFSPAGIFHNIPIESFTGSSRQSYQRLSSPAEILKRKGRNTSQPGEAILFGGLKYDDMPDIGLLSDSLGQTLPSQRYIDLNSRAGVSFLPASLSEVNSIHKTFSSNNLPARLFTGASGSEEQFKALSGKRLGVLHFATHGFYYTPEKSAAAGRSLRKMFSNDNSLSESDRAMFRTGLLLSGANYKLRGKTLPNSKEDGILTAMEISAADFYGTPLAVLSTCQSGLGDISPEGVFGLPRALKKAGVQAIVMSLWKVDDEATAILMDNFYRFYTLGQSASISLARAQEKLKNDNRFSDPRYWAAFVVLDDIE